MPDQPIKYNSQLEKDEHDDSANITGKRVFLFGWNSSTLQYERLASSGGVLQIAGGSGSNASVGSNGVAIPTSSTLVGLEDASGNLQPISSTNPVPISGSITATNPSVGTDGSAIPLSSTLIGGSDGINLQPLQVDGSNNLKTIINAPLPAGTNVLGHVIVDTAPTTAVTGTFFQTTQPVSAASLPLPSGAATAAKQPALGIAGTASSDVLSIQGIASMTALTVNGSGFTQPVSGTFWQATQPVSLASVPSHAVTNAGTFAVQNTSATPAGTNVIGALTANQSVNVAQMNGVTTTMGNGTSGTGVQRVAIASDNTVLPGVGAGATGSTPPANASYQGNIASNANPTAATNGNLVGTMGDLKGRSVVQLGHVRELRGKQTTTISASTSETTIITAAASTFNDLVAVIISNTSATAARVDIRDTTAGTVLFSLYIPAGDVRGFSLPGSSIPQTSVNTNWTAQSSASVTDLRVFAVFEKNT